MRDDVITWIVIADAREATAYEERVRHGPLRKATGFEHLAETGGSETSHRHRATGHARHGNVRHGIGERDPALAREAKFLGDIAERLEAAALDQRFQGLVLMAAPRALGLLREALGPHASACIEVTDPHDRTELSVDEVRAALQSARIPA